MRLIHTSDWHIGRRFNEHDLLADQADFGDWIVDIVRTEQIDAVLLAGDVFDRSNPAADAISLAGSILERIVDCGATVVMISGNHDSAERLGFASAFTSKGGLHIVTERRALLDISGRVELLGRDGDTVEVLAVPFLEPSRITDLAGADRTHEAVIARTLEALRNDATDPARTIVMAHAFVTDGAAQTSESERMLAVGGVDNVSTEVFDGFGYVALGHLHRPQVVGSETVVYSGSPLAYSFSEDHEKSVRIVTTDGGLSSEMITVGAGRPVRTIEGSLEHLLTSGEYADAETGWVRAVLTDDTLQLGAMERLRARFPHILQLDQTGALGAQSTAVVRNDKGEARPPGEIVEDYVADMFGNELDDEIRSFIVDSVNSSLHAGDDA